MNKIYILRIQKVNKFNIESEQKYAFYDFDLTKYVFEEFSKFYKDQIGKNPGILIYVEEIDLFTDKSQFNISKNTVKSDPLRRLSSGYAITGGRKRPFR